MRQKDNENSNQKKRNKNNFKIEQEDLSNKRKKSNQSIKEKKQSKKFKRKVFMFIFLTILILLSVLFFKLYTFKTLAQEMFNNSPSTVFGANKSIIDEVGSERNRENINYKEIPKNLINAYISIEDQRYFTHHGVDIKRTSAAILSYVTQKGSSSFGGSTITQQLVKNLTGDDSSTVYRKVKEWFYAWTLNAFFSKEAVLEAYFNIIYTGPNIYGVQTASHYYFSKDVQDLSLAECAYLAGLNNSPNSYNPFTESDKTEKIAKRTTTVLNKMLELNLISQNEYDLANLEVANGLSFKKGLLDNKNKIYSYHTDALINQVISDLTKTKHISNDFATNFIYMSGSSIYSTENIEIQKILEQETQNTKYIIPSSNGEDSSQTALVVIDHRSGKVIACIRWFRAKGLFKML